MSDKPGRRVAKGRGRRAAGEKAGPERPPGAAEETTATPVRRGRGFRAAGAAIAQPLSRTAARFGFAEPDVLLNWDAILGPAIAPLCRPVAVRYAGRGGFGATLVVAAEGAVALKVEHLAPRIIERVNTHYGYRAVSHLNVTQAQGRRGRGAAKGLSEAQAVFSGPEPGSGAAPGPVNAARGMPAGPAPVLPEAEVRAAAKVAHVTDPDLRDALLEMGRYVLSRPGKSGPEKPGRTAAAGAAESGAGGGIDPKPSPRKP